MAKRLIDTVWTGSIRVKTYYDSEWQEYTCVLLVNGKRIDEATYFTNDKADAISTAQDMMLRAFNNYTPLGEIVVNFDSI